MNTITVRNPLWDKVMTEYTSWREWLEKWNQTTEKRDLISLLHVGFDFGNVPGLGMVIREEMDRFLFYLNIANGWNSGGYYHYANDDPRPRFPPDEWISRSKISKKAFDMLCVYSFKEWIEAGDGRKHLDSRYNSEFLLPVLMHFFGRKSRDGDFRIYNISYGSLSRLSNNEMVAQKFLFKLIDNIWNWERRYVNTFKSHQVEEAQSEESKQTALRLRAARPWSIEVLNCLGQLDKLNNIEDLGEECEVKLTEIAMRCRIAPRGERIRPVKNFEEALKAKDSAAWFLHKYRMTR